MYPHERSLVKRLANEPFALIGVNSDPRERAKQAVKENDITWRSFWDGGSTGGPIATKWNVSGWPTLYIFDHQGVIRHKSVGSPGAEKLDEWIDALLADVNQPAGKQPPERGEDKAEVAKPAKKERKQEDER